MHRPKASRPKTLVEGVRIMLDEMFEALEESLAELNSEQVWSHPLEGRHSIGVIMAHLQDNIDRHACYLQVGEQALEHDERFAVYSKPVERFVDLENVPDVEALRRRNAVLREAVMRTLDGVEDAELYTPRFSEQTGWWQEHKRVSIDGYHRVVWHANAHLRQIWCLRGAMGAFGEKAFPKQFWH